MHFSQMTLRIGGEFHEAAISYPSELRISHDSKSFERSHKSPVLKNHEIAFEQFRPQFKLGEEEMAFEHYNNNQRYPKHLHCYSNSCARQSHDYPLDEKLPNDKVVLIPFDKIKVHHYEMSPKEIHLQHKWIRKQAQKDIQKEIRIIEKELDDQEYEYDDDILCENEQNYKRALYPLTQIQREPFDRTSIEYAYQEKCIERKALNDAKRDEEMAYRNLIH